ncbi:helix-turn-helix domain-containing protein [Paraburkholderia rhynchosiae]|uniref:AraC family transcriptional regulator n=1 Tax=Paraburkholderia rhynchosiae TaxID=487049 RepID=A0A2N7WH71_9BURK|nr:helix-turn-helix domain-containing protein [Paraburkholderia rhynchosiae]PMS28770.1 AraC family transcriptional regulator [Paraburkholderia rhynchosiae]CAB3657113.1 Transcriptional activator FeaR [Paraburkholderia rhynchosiae]
MYFEAWNAALQQNCGHYFGAPRKGQKVIDGHFWSRDVAGLSTVDIACDIEKIDRPIEGVRRDGREYAFLIAPTSGQIQMEQDGKRSIVAPGDLFLLDSTLPATVGFGDAFCRYIAVHVPRALLMLDGPPGLMTGAPHCADRAALLRLYRYVLNWNDTKRGGDADYLLGLTRATFSHNDASRPAKVMRTPRLRFELAVREIDTFLNSAELSLPWLAQRLGISTRQLDRDFEANGTSFVQTLRAKRLKLAAEYMDVSVRSGRVVRIIDLAQDSGFRDLSNFNRAFKAAFGVTPGDYLRGGCQIGLAPA